MEPTAARKEPLLILCRAGFPSILLEYIPASQSAVGFIVDTPFQASQAGEQGQRLDVENRILFICFGQVVIRDL